MTKKLAVNSLLYGFWSSTVLETSSMEGEVVVLLNIHLYVSRVFGLDTQVEALQQELDALYLNTFGDVKLPAEEGDKEDSAASFEGMDEAAFSALGRTDPNLMKRLMASISADTATW
eukprot:1183188-Prorocentrum_minimum.AAC.2